MMTSGLGSRVCTMRRLISPGQHDSPQPAATLLPPQTPFTFKQAIKTSIWSLEMPGKAAGTSSLPLRRYFFSFTAAPLTSHLRLQIPPFLLFDAFQLLGDAHMITIPRTTEWGKQSVRIKNMSCKFGIFFFFLPLTSSSCNLHNHDSHCYQEFRQCSEHKLRRDPKLKCLWNVWFTEIWAFS